MLQLLLLLYPLVVGACESQSASEQLLIFKNKTQGPIGLMTTSAGAPIESKDAGSTLNANLLTNEFLMESMTHLVRERIPGRVVHAKGAGAFGYFITTHDISDKCKAAFLSEIGKRTPIAVRFSVTITERGGSDLKREPRGFAVKFYTEDGNFDILGLNTPMFAFKDPNLFSSFVHVLKKNPVTDFSDVNMIWDFITLHPESLFIFLFLFSDQGIPKGYRHMPGFSIHTFPLYNEAGKISYGRFHFRPHSGTKWLNSTEAARLGAVDPDYSARDLYNAIAAGDYPAWEVSLQLMSEEDVKNATFDPFDVTLVVPESQFPLYPIGKIVLNRNPNNYFADVEQMAFCPGNLVPGILGSPDKMFESRRFAYRDAQRYRLGTNFDKILVNCPYRTNVFSYNRDGSPPVSTNGNSAPNYYPNSFNGPAPYKDINRPSIPKNHEAEANNIDQVKDFYMNQITSEERRRLIQNMVKSLCGAAVFLQVRAIKILGQINFELAYQVTELLKENNCRQQCSYTRK